VLIVISDDSIHRHSRNERLNAAAAAVARVSLSDCVLVADGILKGSPFVAFVKLLCRLVCFARAARQ